MLQDVADMSLTHHFWTEQFINSNLYSKTETRVQRKSPALIKGRIQRASCGFGIITRELDFKNVSNSMAGASSSLIGSFWTSKQLQNQNVSKDKTRDLPIHDHVTDLAISEDKEGNLWN